MWKSECNSGRLIMAPCVEGAILLVCRQLTTYAPKFWTRPTTTVEVVAEQELRAVREMRKCAQKRVKQVLYREDRNKYDALLTEPSVGTLTSLEKRLEALQRALATSLQQLLRAYMHRMLYLGNDVGPPLSVAVSQSPDRHNTEWSWQIAN